MIMLRLSYLIKGDFKPTLLRTALLSLIFGIIVWYILYEHEYISENSADMLELVLLFYGITEGLWLLVRLIRSRRDGIGDYVSAIWRSLVVAVTPIVVHILFLVGELLWTFSHVLYE